MPSERQTPDGVRALVDSVLSTHLPPPSERRRIRTKAGVSYRRAGAAMGVSAAAVQAWERGAQPRPDLAVIYRSFLEALDEALTGVA